MPEAFSSAAANQSIGRGNEIEVDYDLPQAGE
jgi:hypothetical protein